nr:MAG TPA: hypothetical protein [Microviridae sp.]
MMLRFKKNLKANGIHVSSCVRSKKFLPVQPGLSYDTGTLHKMWKQGLPINPQNASQVYDEGTTNPSWEIPLASHRFIDPAEVWQAQQQARYKISRAYRSRQLKESE